MAVPSVEIVRESLQSLLAALSQPSEDFDSGAAATAALKCSATSKALAEEMKAFAHDIRAVGNNAKRATKDNAHVQNEALELEAIASKIPLTEGLDKRQDAHLRQVFVQEALYQQSSAQSDALAVAFRLGKSALLRQQLDATAQPEHQSPALTFYAQLQSQLTCNQVQDHVLGLLPGTIPTSDNVVGACEPKACRDPALTSPQSSLAHLAAPPDFCASNLSLVALRGGSIDDEHHYRCSFTTRRGGCTVRVHAQDIVAPAGSGQGMLVKFSADLFLGDACDTANRLFNSGEIGAAQVVTKIIWPAMDQWKAS